MIPLDDHAGLPAAAAAQLAAAVARLTTLEQVIRWGLARPTPRAIADVITQDEYTHDVVMTWDRGAYLVFDTT